MTQVVIVGAGPTGLTLALLLVQRGITVKLIEASGSFRRIFRGEALMPSGLEAIEQMGLSQIITNIPHRALDAWEFYIEGRPVFRVNEPMEKGGQPCTLVSQPALLEKILAQAHAYQNFEFLPGSAVQDLLWAGDSSNERVSGVKLGNGQIINAELVIGADGRNSQVRQKANLALQQAEQSFDILWFKLASNPQWSENIFYCILQGDAAFGVFQGAEGNLQVGWSLPKSDGGNWQQADWTEKLAEAAPSWLASHFREQRSTLERPLLLSIGVGRCPQWHVPGMLLLGDAAHPMSPIRAQGINMALRDVIVTVNYLVPLLSQAASLGEIDRVLPQIQAAREPEIIEIQRLQQAEVGQADLMHNYPFLRHAVSQLAPLIGSKVRKSWLDRQLQLRRGYTKVSLQH